MKNDDLSQLWNSQNENPEFEHPEAIVKRANKQRNKQFVSIAIMSTTVLVLVGYAAVYANSEWNAFNWGLLLMISSLSIRVFVEFLTMYIKENQLVLLDAKAFRAYLKKYYRLRLRVNYLLTPICFAVYIFGFVQLLPYFKEAFSEGFYIYLLVSGFGSIAVIAFIVARTVIKELSYLKALNNQ